MHSNHLISQLLPNFQFLYDYFDNNNEHSSINILQLVSSMLLGRNRELRPKDRIFTLLFQKSTKSDRVMKLPLKQVCRNKHNIRNVYFSQYANYTYETYNCFP